MDRRIRIGGAFGLLVVLLVGGLVVGEDGGAVLLGVLAFVATLCLWNISVHYRGWITDESVHWNRRDWLRFQLVFAGVGLLAELVGALVLDDASDANSHVQAGIGVLLILLGFVPVAQVVRAKLSEIVPDEEPLRSDVAWAINIGLIVVATAGPVVVLRPTAKGVVLGLVLAGGWVLAEVAERLEFAHPAWGYVGGALLAVPVVLFAFTTLGLETWGVAVLALAFGLGLLLMTGRQRRERQEAPGTVDRLVRATGGTDALIRALVLGGLGLGWLLWAVEGGTFHLGLLAVGILAPVAFGVSLITRGEGLLLVVVAGLLAIWVVQDHTVADESTLPAGEADGPLIAAFGDSYMSGEGTGVFFEGTDTAGDNECRRSPEAYSVRVATTLAEQGPDPELLFFACSGAKAVTDDFYDDVIAPDLDELDPTVSDRRIRNERRRNSLYGQFLRWEANAATADRTPDLVLLSLGGNDAGFAKIGAACFMPGSCGPALEAAYDLGDDGDDGDGARKAGRLVLVDHRVAVTLHKAVEVFPDTPMVVIAYPNMFGPATDKCGGQVPFDGDEIDLLRTLVVDLNAEVNSGVDAVNTARGTTDITFWAAGADAFAGEAFCEVDEAGDLIEDHPAMNTIAVEPTEGVDLLARLFPSKLIHNTFHPRVRGHELIAESLGEFLVARCWEVANQSAEPCGRGLEVSPPVAVSEPVTTRTSELEALVIGEGACTDLEDFVQCSIVRSVRVVVWPAILLALAGLYLALAARRSGVEHFLVTAVTGVAPDA